MSSTDSMLDDGRITDFGLLVEAHRRLTRTFEASMRRTCGLAGPGFEVLLRVGRSSQGRLPMTELGRQLGLTGGGTTRLVDRLAAEGYVRRAGCPSDRRVQYVELTDRGDALLREGIHVHLADLQTEMVDRLDADELSALRRALDKLR